MRSAVVLAAFSLAACGKARAVAKDEIVAKDEPVAKQETVAKEETVADDSPAPPLAFGSVPHLFGALEGMTIGVTTTAEVQRVPGMERLDHERVETYALERGGVLYAIEMRRGTISRVTFKVRRVTPDALVKAWGAGSVNKSGDVTILDPAHHLRATVSEFAAADRAQIEMQSYVPLASLFDRDPATLFGMPVLGRPEEEVDRALASHYFARDDVSAMLDATEISDGNIQLTLFPNSAGIVETYALDNVLDDPTTATVDKVSSMFASLWGPGRPHDDSTEYGTAVPVRVDSSFVIRVGAANP